MVSFLQSLLLLFHFCVFLSQLSELVWKLAEEISLESTSKRFPSFISIFGPPANGNKSNAKNPIVELVATQHFRNLEQPDLLQDRPNSWVLKRATTLLNSFRNN